MIRTRAFTTLELVISLIIMAIIASVAMMNYGDNKGKLDSQMQQLVADIYYVQGQATANDASYCMSFAGSTSYSLYKSDCTTPLVQPSLQTSEVVLPSGMTLHATGLVSNQLKFSRKGVPQDNTDTDLSADATITLTNSDGNTSTVTITPGTGHLDIT